MKLVRTVIETEQAAANATRPTAHAEVSPSSSAISSPAEQRAQAQRSGSSAVDVVPALETAPVTFDTIRNAPAARATFREIHKQVKLIEGGVNHDEKALGTYTAYGIHPRTAARYGKTPLELNAKERNQIYYQDYWRTQRCHQMPESAAMAVYDVSVYMGNGRARLMLLKAMGAIGEEVDIGAKIRPGSELSKILSNRDLYRTAVAALGSCDKEELAYVLRRFFDTQHELNRRFCGERLRCNKYQVWERRMHLTAERSGVDLGSGAEHQFAQFENRMAQVNQGAWMIRALAPASAASAPTGGSRPISSDLNFWNYLQAKREGVSPEQLSKLLSTSSVPMQPRPAYPASVKLNSNLLASGDEASGPVSRRLRHQD
ncbi:MAG: hypothetical protein K1X83_05020 [Oligoflexia bacterium]|nr:hypothetical protein [Oligoflexia bacterium]